MNCNNCGANLPEGVKFCPRCGSAVEASYEANPYDYGNARSASDNYQGGSQPPYPPQPEPINYGAYQQPVNTYQSMPQTDLTDLPVTVGSWIGVFLISCLPLVNLIMLFVWAFSSSTKKSLKNYARAMLIMSLIGIVLGIIIAVIVSIIGANVHTYRY